MRSFCTGEAPCSRGLWPQHPAVKIAVGLMAGGGKRAGIVRPVGSLNQEERSLYARSENSLPGPAWAFEITSQWFGCHSPAALFPLHAPPA